MKCRIANAMENFFFILSIILILALAGIGCVLLKSPAGIVFSILIVPIINYGFKPLMCYISERANKERASK